jgi:glutamate:GABA antiporter
VMASMTVITYFIPYLYVFAAMMKLQNEPAGPDVIRVPGGKLLAVAISLVGLLATSFTILISVVPQPEDPNKPLAILKIVGLTALLLGVGAWIYGTGKRKILLTTRGV